MPLWLANAAGWGENILGLEKNQPRLPPHEPEIGANSGLRELRSGLEQALRKRKNRTLSWLQRP